MDDDRPRFFPKLEGEERAKALADPGPPWKDWARYSLARTWVILGFFIVDLFLVEGFGAPFDPIALVLSLAAAIYLEWLAYEYLWHRPEGVRRFFRRPESTSRWLRPVALGRWTPEAFLREKGVAFDLPTADDPAAVDPDEFL